MRVTIIPSDGVVIVDGVAVHGLNMSDIDASVHAVQWYGSKGVVEYIENVPPAEIDSIVPFQPLLDRHAAIVAEANRPPTAAELKQQEIADIKRQLESLDIKSIRPLRDGDGARVASIEVEAVALRARMVELMLP